MTSFIRCRRFLLLGLLLVPVVHTSTTANPGDFQITDIKARLLYEQSGELSEDITANPDFVISNTLIGEGSAKENAEDLLISVQIDGPGQEFIDVPLTISVRGKGNRLVAERKLPQFLAESTTIRSLMLPRAACLGLVKIEARLGGQSLTEEVNLNCSY